MTSNPLSEKLYVRDLKEHLEKSGISPEKFAAEVQLSHMTIRRWLRRKDNEAISEKYYSLLAPVLKKGGASSFSFSDLMSEIEKSGKEFKSTEQLGDDLKEKLKTTRVDKAFIGYCKQLFDIVRSPKTSMKSRAIAAGALIYFISPIDLIPDATPVIGYLDDLAVLSVAAESIRKIELKESKKTRLSS